MPDVRRFASGDEMAVLMHLIRSKEQIFAAARLPENGAIIADAFDNSVASEEVTAVEIPGKLRKKVRFGHHAIVRWF